MAQADTVTPEALIATTDTEGDDQGSAVEQGANGGDQERGKSTIQFPYLDLSEAVAIAKGVHNEGGNSCQVDQLAARLQQKADAPKFRQKLGTAKMFGLITYGSGTVALTPLGVSINVPQREAAAKAEAFLLIPLYKQVYEQFRGGNLPPLPALENAMATLGVAPKQKGHARQVFFRSALQAGFFTHGTNRLVAPSFKAGDAPPPAGQTPGDTSIHEKPPKPGGNGNGGGGDDPAIQGLIQRLPPPDSDWPLEKQAKWLLALSHAFDVIYPRDEDDRNLKIEIVKD